MVFSLDVKAIGLRQVQRLITQLPKDIMRFQRSALQSTGFWLASPKTGKFGEWIKNTPSVWPKLSPLSQKFRSSFQRGNPRWTRRNRPKPLLWMKKFTRYRVDKKGTLLQVVFGKTRKKQRPGPVDATFGPIIRRLQKGHVTKTTNRMRRFFFTKPRRKKRKKDDRTRKPFPASLTTPPRLFFDPFFATHKAQIIAQYKRRFTKRIKRFNREGK